MFNKQGQLFPKIPGHCLTQGIEGKFEMNTRLISGGCNNGLPILEDEILGVSRNGTNGVLLAVATEGLGAVSVLAAAAVTEGTHHRVDLLLEYFG